MNFVVTVFVAGVLGTLAMDLLNNLIARTGVFLKIDVAMIGRMAVGWTHGRYRYGHPDEMEQVTNELIYGYLAHFAIGVFHWKAQDLEQARLELDRALHSPEVSPLLRQRIQFFLERLDQTDSSDP